MKKIFLIALTSVCCITGYAQQDTTEVLDEAVVATKYLSPVSVGGMELPVINIPQSVSVVNPTRIREFNMNTIDEALRDIPGVTTIANDYMRSQYKSRGYNMSIMYDGLPSYNSLAISQQLDLSFYEQIEVLRGPAGMLQGKVAGLTVTNPDGGDPNAMGGMDTMQPDDEVVDITELTDAQEATQEELESFDSKFTKAIKAGNHLIITLNHEKAFIYVRSHRCVCVMWRSSRARHTGNSTS